MPKYRTAQRKQIHDLFAKNPHENFTAKEIADLLGSGAVSISAIYRNLSELESSGLVRRSVKSGSREAFFQYTGTEDCKEHIHLTCLKCGQTVHMTLADSDALKESVSKYRNFTVDKAETVLYGLCGGCRNPQ